MTAVWTGRRYPIELYVRPDTSDVKAAREVIDDNTYQRPRLGFTIDPGDRWLDAGANIGAFAALATHLGAAYVVSVEPIEAHVDLLTANTDRDRVLVVAGAVTSPGATDPVSINIYPPEVAWRSSSLRSHAGTLETVTVPAYPIDALISAFDLDCVKLDVEGGEIDIMESWLPPPTVRKVAWEWSFDLDPSIPRLRSVIRTLEALDFQTSAHTYVTKGRGIAARRDTWPGYPRTDLCLAWR